MKKKYASPFVNRGLINGESQKYPITSQVSTKNEFKKKNIRFSGRVNSVIDDVNNVIDIQSYKNVQKDYD